MKKNSSTSNDHLVQMLKKSAKRELSAEHKREQRINYAMSCSGDYSEKSRKLAEEVVDKFYG
ncbi:MAG: hypothetical protein OXC92_02715 [Flavobacteriaceae bacterium]|nr:hypothetical protein [Flavobacteriaceae bacterium]MCY4299173.1 hypothetical protein [Flavobacteriaceae bacterium]